MLIQFILAKWWWKDVEMLTFAIFLMLGVLFALRRDNILTHKNRFITLISETSYPFFLMHESIGVILISLFSVKFGRLNWSLPIILFISLWALSMCYCKFVEKPLISRINYLVSNGRNNNRA